MADDRAAGQVIDARYELRAPLGHGGMGVVWRAYDSLLGREVAVKEIRFPSIVGQAGREALCGRLRDDARRSSALEHRSLVRVLDVVDEDGRPFVVTELVEAPTLAERVAAGGPLPPEQVAAIGVELLDVLAVAHARGLVHRFVQPAKVLLPPEGGARLGDFGLAALVGDPLVTPTGAIGTVSYMAPEQNGRPLGDEATDVWSVGATLFYAVEGRPPFDAGAAKATLAAIAGSPPRPLLRAGALRPVLEGVLVKDPAARPDVATLRRLLADVAAGPAPPEPLAVEPIVEGGAPRPWYERESLADPVERSFFEYETTSPAVLPEPEPPAPPPPPPVVVAEPQPAAPPEPAAAPRAFFEYETTPPAVGAEPEPVPVPRDEDDATAGDDEDDDDDGGVWRVGVAFGPDTPDDDPTPPPRAVGTDAFFEDAPLLDDDLDFRPAPEPEPEPPPLPPKVALSRMFSPDVERPPPPYVDAVPPEEPPPRSLWPLPRPWRPGVAFLAGMVIVVLVFLVVTGTQFLTGRNDRVARNLSSAVNWVPYTDPGTGFRIEHPSTWTVNPNEGVVDFRDPASSAALRVAVQQSGKTPEQGWLDLEQRFKAEHPSYQRVRLEPTIKDGREAAVWEFTWTDASGTELHNSDIAMNAGGTAFALNFQTRADEWELLKSLFDRLTSSFEPPPPA